MSGYSQTRHSDRVHVVDTDRGERGFIDGLPSAPSAPGGANNWLRQFPIGVHDFLLDP